MRLTQYPRRIRQGTMNQRGSFPKLPAFPRKRRETDPSHRFQFGSTISTEQISCEAEDAIAGDKLATSIPEADIEENGNRLVITGQHGGVEDLFSNWVDAPSLSSAWMPRNPRPGSTTPIPSTPSDSSPDKSQAEADSKASNDVQAKPAAEPGKAASNTAVVPSKPAIPPGKSQESATSAPKNTTPVQPPVPTKTPVPRHTRGQRLRLALWNVASQHAHCRQPHRRGSIIGSNSSRRACNRKESSNLKVTGARENPTPVAKLRGLPGSSQGA